MQVERTAAHALHGQDSLQDLTDSSSDDASPRRELRGSSCRTPSLGASGPTSEVLAGAARFFFF